jgi:hypothetical protein
VAAVDAVEVPKVETRLSGVRIGDGPKAALAAKQSLARQRALRAPERRRVKN